MSESKPVAGSPKQEEEMLRDILSELQKMSTRFETMEARVQTLESPVKRTPPTAGSPKSPPAYPDTATRGIFGLDFVPTEEDSQELPSDVEYNPTKKELDFKTLPKTPAPAERSRRTSLFERQADANERYAVTPVVQAIQPKYDHIRLSAVTVSQTFKFFHEVNHYEMQVGVKLPVTTMVEDKVRELIIARNPELTETKFYQLKVKDLFRYVQDLIKPTTIVDFREKLERNIEFVMPKGYSPLPTDFHVFYNALLIYRARFRKVYELLAYDNEDNCPECTNKEGGLIRSFLNPIPFEYGTRVMVQMGSKRKFSEIHEFLTAFYKYVEIHREQNRAAVQLRQAFGGTEYKTTNAAQAVPRQLFQSRSATHRVQAVEEVAMEYVADNESPNEDIANDSDEGERLVQICSRSN
jgi:hypothetical protein